MENKIKKVIENLKKRHWCLGIMESCTGGALMNLVTNIPGVSDVFKSGLVTYSDEAKIKAGVDQKIIKTYGVYSIEVAEEMAKKIEGNVGIGVTGNLPGKVYVAIRVYSAKQNILRSNCFKVSSLLKDEIEARKEMKGMVIDRVLEMISQELM